MKRLGKFTGNLYEPKDVMTMDECGVMISDNEANDEKFIKKQHAKHLAECLNCLGCPLSQKSCTIVNT